MIKSPAKNKLIADKKLLLIIVLIAVIIIIIGISPKLKEKSFGIEDKCGKFVNLMSHTIDDANQCTIRCKSQCASAKSTYKKSDFRKNDVGCNSCTCYCS